MPESDAEFEARKLRSIAAMAADTTFRSVGDDWFLRAFQHRYSYNFRWLGVPIIQFPADIVAMQELIWHVRPQVIIETGVARGGSLIFYASILQLLNNDGVVIGVEIALTSENRTIIQSHPLGRYIRIVDGSSITHDTVMTVRAGAGARAPILVILDSYHTHEHVLQELRAYAPLVSRGSYVVVFDTVVDDLPPHVHGERPWGPGNNPKTAVHAFLKETDRFEIDRSFDRRLQLSSCPEGFLRCVRD
jgi:cephalosporin hydroxylase